MKNKDILHANQQTDIYRHHYQPSLNVFRPIRSILAMLFFGNSTVASTHMITRKRNLK